MSMLYFPPPSEVGGLPFDFRVPTIMGILNTTPDSFSDGGLHVSPDDALRRAEAMVLAGARIIDVGGESTRPGARAVGEAEERARVVPVLERLAKAGLPAVLSVDTRKASVAHAALENGATMVNDITAMRDPDMPAVVAKHAAHIILMHIRGEPQTMQEHTDYDDVVDTVRAALAASVQRGVTSGVAHDRLWIDPGLGFAKETHHNLQLTRRMGEFGELRCPIVYGPSRKSFLGKLTGKPPKERDQATAAACVAAVLAGAHVVRVHNVAAVSDALRVAAAIRDAH